MRAQLNELGFYTLAGAPQSPAELLDEVAAAEDQGLGSAFISERYNIKEASTLSGAVGAVSHTLGIATAATNHNTRHPLVTATFGMTMHQLTGGRFALGLGRGFDPLFQFMHEEDAARAITLALERKVRGVFNVAGPQPLPLSELIRITRRRPAPIAESLYPLALGRFGLPMLPRGAVAHVKYPIVVSDSAFRKATGFTHQHNEYQTLQAFAEACPPKGAGP